MYGLIFLEIVSFQTINCDCLSGTEIIETNITVENKGEIILTECHRINEDKREKNHETFTFFTSLLPFTKANMARKLKVLVPL